MVQEELAEKISNMVHVFAVADPQLGFEPFVRCALVTLGREWFGLDKWRVDKFMMFVRRLLRQTFRFCKAIGWRNADSVAGVVAESVLRGGHTLQSSPPSLGFQLHFVDVFLEELAKVDGGDGGMDDEVIRALVRPFLAEVRDGKDERLRGHIEERIFQHLMRQSDVGIAYDQDDDEDDEETVESGDGEEDGEGDERWRRDGVG